MDQLEPVRQPTHEEVRARFKEFAGDEKFRDFVREIHYFNIPPGRLRFWQDKIWDPFVAQNPDCGMGFEELVIAFRVCHLHGCELKSTSVPVVEKCVNYMADYFNERPRQFPHASPKVVSIEEFPNALGQATVFYCEACDRVRDVSRWGTEAFYELANPPPELAEALEVARSGVRSKISEGDEKLLGFLLKEGECDARIAEPIEVKYSWLEKRNPSTYFGSLGPGLISQFMDLGSIKSINGVTEFSVGPGSTGTDRYRISFDKKWVSIRCTEEEIFIRVRERQSDLKHPLTMPRDEPPPKLTPIEYLAIFACMGCFIFAFLGTLIGSNWFLPSPWYLLGAIPATFLVWAVLRESVIETFVIFVILLFVLWLLRLPVQQVKQRFQPAAQRLEREVARLASLEAVGGTVNRATRL